MSYTGNVSVTKNGRVCQRWDEQSPHQHGYITDNFPDSNMSHNYCRQLNADVIWCFTTDPLIERAMCDVRFCGKYPL